MLGGHPSQIGLAFTPHPPTEDSRLRIDERAGGHGSEPQYPQAPTRIALNSGHDRRARQWRLQ